jgi:hypothetical protein
VLLVIGLAVTGSGGDPPAPVRQETPEEIKSRRDVEARAAKEYRKVQAREGIPAAAASLPPEIKLGQLDRSYGLLEGGFTLKNPNNVPIKDVGILCEVTAPSGTIIHHYRFTIFEIVPAKGEKTVRNYKFGFWPQQGKSISCGVANSAG